MIARALGGVVSGAQVIAPGPGHSARDRSMTVRLSPSSPDGFITFSHAGDDFRACRDYVRERLGIVRDAPKGQRVRSRSAPLEQPDEPDERNLAAARRIVSKIVPLIGTSGETYLKAIRKIDTAVISDVLVRTDAIGWHPAVYLNEPGHALHGREIGCIVAVMTDAMTAKPTGAISRTYISPDLLKVGKAKTLGTPAGVVRISPDEEVLEGLFLAEGLETALAGMAIGLRPMWSTGSSALMASFPLLDGVEVLNVIVDHDANGAGEAAAREVEARWRGAGREVNLYRPRAHGDLNDVLAGGMK
jgi:hypothetical protein